MTGLILFFVAAYLVAVILSYLMHPTVTFGAEFNPTLSYGTRAKITASFTVKGVGPAYIFSILVPFASIEDNTNAGIWEELYALASCAVSSWALRPKRNPDELLQKLSDLSSPCFLVVRCAITDMVIPPEPAKPEPPPRPKSHAERMLDEFDDRLFGASLFINRVSSAKRMYPELWTDPIGRGILRKVSNAIKGQILKGEPTEQSYRGYRVGARKNRAEGLG
jgi:hypothetical protein